MIYAYSNCQDIITDKLYIYIYTHTHTHSHTQTQMEKGRK